MAWKRAARTSSVRATGLLRAYPRWWRDRYGEEMAALLDARPPDLRARVDLVRGALDARLRVPEPGARPWGAIAVALIAGAAWTIIGVASVLGPSPPDWPGYLQATLPVAVIGAVAVLGATLAVVRLAWPATGRSTELAVIAAVAAHVAWASALLIALLGGPYGAVTAIAQTLAAIATVAVGLVLMRAGTHPVGEAVVVAGAMLLVPTPMAWLVTGAAWTGIGLWQYAGTPSGDLPRASAG